MSHSPWSCRVGRDWVPEHTHDTVEGTPAVDAAGTAEHLCTKRSLGGHYTKWGWQEVQGVTPSTRNEQWPEPNHPRALEPD